MAVSVFSAGLPHYDCRSGCYPTAPSLPNGRTGSHSNSLKDTSERTLQFVPQLAIQRPANQRMDRPMRARIYQPAKTAMSSGAAKTRQWVLEFAPASARDVDPLMGWTSSSDMQSQVRLTFDSKEAAMEYASDNGIEATVQEPKPRRANIRARGYAENFAPERRGAWTH